MKVIIVGGVAGGASCAARLRRLDEKAVMDDVMAAGVEGFVLKHRAVVDLIPAIRGVLQGGKYISPHIT